MEHPHVPTDPRLHSEPRAPGRVEVAPLDWWCLLQIVLALVLFWPVFSDVPGGVAARLALLTAGVAVAWGSIALHELAHAVVLASYGTDVRVLATGPLLGLTSRNADLAPARVEGDGDGEATEPAPWPWPAIAAGPLCNLTLSAVATIAHGHAVGAPLPVRILLTWTVVINASIGWFNLVPVAPLDGGRLLTDGLRRTAGSRPGGTAIVLARLVPAAGVGIGFCLAVRSGLGAIDSPGIGTVLGVGFWSVVSFASLCQLETSDPASDRSSLDRVVVVAGLVAGGLIGWSQLFGAIR